MAATIPIADIPTAYGTISISRSPASGTLVYTVDGQRQGAVDKSGVTLAYYIHAFYGLLIQAKSRNILMIGGACCTLGTMLAKAGCQVTIVDINPASPAVARQHFGLPDSVICHSADGALFLRGDTGEYDAIVLDAFHGAHTPSHLLTPAFFALVREHLAPDGVALVNILTKHRFDKGADRAARSMKRIWSDVRVLEMVGPPDRNAIVMAGAVAQLQEPPLLVRPQTNPHVIAQELARMKFRPWKTSRWRFFQRTRDSYGIPRRNP
jgi:spermidine synthase